MFESLSFRRRPFTTEASRSSRDLLAALEAATKAVEGVAEAVPLPAVFGARQPFTVPARQTA